MLINPRVINGVTPQAQPIASSQRCGGEASLKITSEKSTDSHTVNKGNVASAVSKKAADRRTFRLLLCARP